MSLGDFLHMGGYAPYVWSCYGLTALVLVGMEWSSRRRLKTVQLQARRRAVVQSHTESPQAGATS